MRRLLYATGLDCFVRINAAVFAALGLVLAAAPASAQWPPYAFVRIADDVHTDSGLRGAHCVGLSDLGTVSVLFVPAAASGSEIWRGNGGTLTKVDTLSGSCASINDFDEFAYLVVTNPGTGAISLVRNSGGVVTTLATSTSFPYLDGSSNTYLPSLNNGGSAVFHTRFAGPGTGAGMYIGPGAIKVYDASTDNPLSFWTTASMNDSLTAVFVASRTVGGVARTGIYRGSDVPLIETGDMTSAGTISVHLARPIINNAGTVAFVGSTAGSPSVYTTDDGVNLTLLGTGSLDRISLSDSGAVAYRKGAGPATGIFVGKPGSPDHKLIDAGDAIDGSILQNAFLWEEAINRHNQVAFLAQLADGRVGVYRADPQWLKALTLKSKVPGGCGPVSGKIKLNAPAPPGGLVVQLSSTNSAASVPATVTVAAGKTSAAFQLSTIAVSSNASGAITALAGSQSVSRNVTVRPIGVTRVTLTPNPVTGGGVVSGEVALECAAAPGDITAQLTSSNPSVAPLTSSSLLFPAGTTTRPFTITTASVGAQATATIKAVANKVSTSKKLTITP